MPVHCNSSLGVTLLASLFCGPNKKVLAHTLRLLINSLSHLLSHLLILSLIHSFTLSFFHLLIRSFTSSLTHLFTYIAHSQSGGSTHVYRLYHVNHTHACTRFLINSLSHLPFTYLFTHSFNLSSFHILTWLFTYSLTYSLAFLLTYKVGGPLMYIMYIMCTTHTHVHAFSLTH